MGYFYDDFKYGPQKAIHTLKYGWSVTSENRFRSNLRMALKKVIIFRSKSHFGTKNQWN